MVADRCGVTSLKATFDFTRRRRYDLKRDALTLAPPERGVVIFVANAIKKVMASAGRWQNVSPRQIARLGNSSKKCYFGCLP